MNMYIGFSALALYIGYLLGASNTPVVGEFLIASFGLVASAIGSEYLLSRSKHKEFSAKQLGNSLIIISVFLFSGTWLGDKHRNYTPEVTLPWGDRKAPSSTHEALDWIATQQKLLLLGYDKSDILKIYDIRLKEIDILSQKNKTSGSTDFDNEFFYDLQKQFNIILTPNSCDSITGLAESKIGPRNEENGEPSLKLPG